MGKSLRSKRENRLRAIKREMVKPIYEKRDEAKQTAMEAALAAPKLPVRITGAAANSMDSDSIPLIPIQGADVEMEDTNKKTGALKPMGKKMKKKLKLAKRKGHSGKAILRKKRI